MWWLVRRKRFLKCAILINANVKLFFNVIWCVSYYENSHYIKAKAPNLFPKVKYWHVDISQKHFSYEKRRSSSLNMSVEMLRVWLCSYSMCFTSVSSHLSLFCVSSHVVPGEAFWHEWYFISEEQGIKAGHFWPLGLE